MALWIVPSALLGVVIFVMNFRAFHGKSEKIACILGLCSFIVGIIGSATIFFVFHRRAGGSTPFEDFAAFASAAAVIAAAACVLYFLCALLSKKMLILRLLFISASWIFLLICTCLFILLTEAGKGETALFILLFGTFSALSTSICPAAELFIKKSSMI